MSRQNLLSLNSKYSKINQSNEIDPFLNNGNKEQILRDLDTSTKIAPESDRATEETSLIKDEK
jgi:hypothetical protein